LYFFQGLIFKRGADVYVGKNRSPKGLGQKDWPQILQLKNSAGSTLVNALNVLNENWDGDPNDFENSMLAGDPVAPAFGRFFTVYNPQKEQLGGEDISELDSYEVGTDGGVEASEADEARGYRSRIDKTLLINGRLSKIPATLTGPALEVAKSRVLFFDDIINLPLLPTDDAVAEMHAEQALRLARALKAYRKVLEFGWHDLPDLFTSDVRKVLTSAKQVGVNTKVPTADEETDLGGMYDDESLYEEPAQSATLGADVAEEFAASDDLDAAADYQELDENGEPVAGEENYDDQDPGEYAADEEYAAADDEEPAEGEEPVEGEELGEAAAEGAEDYELVDADQLPEGVEGVDYEIVDAEENPEGESDGGQEGAATEEYADEEYDDPDAGADSDEVADEEAEALAALEAAKKRSASRKKAEPAVEPKPAATKPAATKPAATKPAATKPAAGAPPAATKPAATKPAATKPAATKPAAGAPPAAAKPAAAKPAAAKPAAAAPSAAQKPVARK
jgi:hypothetical protein